MDPTDLRLDDIRVSVAGGSVGRDIRYFPTVDSTNRVAADLPPGNWSSGTIVMTDFQSAGRGRAGRSWVAPAGSSVMLSVIFARRPDIPPADYVMMMALAARDAVAGVTHLDPYLKWPNDLLVANRKVAGILGESSKQNGIDRVILGIGINVTSGAVVSTALSDTATSLDRETGSSVAREDIATAFIGSVDLWYRSLTHRRDDVFDAWAAALHTVGLPVTIQDSRVTWNGTALGVERDGGLLVETIDGTVRSVHAGDVSVRHAQECTGQ